MNKSKNLPKADNPTPAPKKAIVSAARKTVKFESPKKGPLFESNFKSTGFLKKPNDSWDY